MSLPTPPFKPGENLTPKELASYIENRSARWVGRQCSLGKIKTLGIGKPYLIPHYESNRLLGYGDDDTTSAG